MNITNEIHKLHDIVLSPMSEEHQWQDVEVITLKQAAIDKATEFVISKVITMTDINAQVNDILNTAEYKVCKEFINIETDKITIGLYCDTINDHMVDIAIDKLMKLDSLSLGIHYDNTEYILNFNCNKKETVVL